MDRKKPQIWSLIARISLRGSVGIVLITVIGGSLVLHLQPGSLGILIPMWIAAGLMFFGIGINAALSSIPASQKKKQLRKENPSE